MELRLKKVGTDSGFCRDHYISENNRRYVHQDSYTDAAGKTIREWLSASKDWEPFCHLRSDIKITIVDKFLGRSKNHGD